MHDHSPTFRHINRRGVEYFFRATNRGGKRSYSAVSKWVPDALDHLPEGYEIYEKPETSQVFIRKIKPTAVFSSEHLEVENAIRVVAGLDNYIVETASSSLIVYLPDLQVAERMRLVGALFPSMGAIQGDTADFMRRHLRFNKVMKFELVDDRRRLFSTERWCSRGSIDDWILLDRGSPLSTALKKYAPHFGRESFYDLM
jgi:hypothetical protein